jgi:hypothetical protein
VSWGIRLIEQDSWNRAAREDSQDSTARKGNGGQDSKNMTERTGQRGWDNRGMKVRIGHIEQDH